MLLGDDLLPLLVLAFGAAMAIGSGLALIRPPEQRKEGDLDRPPLGRSIAMIVVGAVAAIWAIASLLAGELVRVACSTWDGGGNVAVFRVLADRLRARGHEVTLQIAWDQPPMLDGDALVVDHMSPIDALHAARSSGRPVAALVHTLWSFVPSLEGTWAPTGYVDALESLDRILVCAAHELDRGAALPGHAVHVGPLIEPEGPDSGWTPPARSLVLVSLGTTDMGEGPVLQRVLDALAPLPIDVVATVPPHLDGSVRAPDNATLTGFVRHAAVLPHADVFVGHGGLGGIMASLAFGVPVVSVPLGRDQPHNAARVEAVGAGRTVAMDAEQTVIRATVEEVRTGMREREGAIRMANAIAGYGAAAVETVESLAPVSWDGDRYQEQFDALAATGEDVHGEATFVRAFAPASVLDAGCGTGRVAIQLARHGVDVVGVDVNASMLATARRAAPAIEWVESDLASLDLGREFDVVVMAGNVLLFTERGTEAAVVAACARHTAGVLVAGFQLDGRYAVERYDEDCAAAGLVLVERFATWDRAPFADGAYAVSVHRR